MATSIDDPIPHKIDEDDFQFHANSDVKDDIKNDVVSIELDASLDFDENWDRGDADDDAKQIVASLLTSASGLVRTKEAPSLAR